VSRALTLLGLSAAAFAVPALAAKAELALLDALQRGQWEVRMRDQTARTERICLQDARRFIQLRHPGLTCQRVVVDDSATAVTVQYTCPGRGYGRTTIRSESPSLVQIDSQGIADGQPFAFAAEARRVGQC